MSNKLTGVELIAQERAKHPKKGWTAEHDAEHKNEELAFAAVCYALPGRFYPLDQSQSFEAGIHIKIDRTCFWPFARNEWNPSVDDRVKELVKSGSFIAAEIDRLNGVDAAQVCDATVNTQSSNADRQTPSYEGEQVEAEKDFEHDVLLILRNGLKIGGYQTRPWITGIEDCAKQIAKTIEAYASSKQVKGEQISQSIVVFKGGSYVITDTNTSWEYENQSDWLATIPSIQTANQHPSKTEKLYRVVKASEEPKIGGYYFCHVHAGEHSIAESIVEWAQHPEYKYWDWDLRNATDVHGNGFGEDAHIIEWLEEVKPGEQTKCIETTFRFYKSDDGPFVGAYAVGSLTAGEPTILFNMDAVMRVAQDEDNKAGFVQDSMLQTISHEFIHALQEWIGKEYDELEVERILGEYNEKWNVFNMETENEEDAPVFRIDEFLQWMDTQDGDLRQAIKELFKPHTLWAEAEKKNSEQGDAVSDTTAADSDSNAGKQNDFIELNELHPSVVNHDPYTHVVTVSPSKEEVKPWHDLEVEPYAFWDGKQKMPLFCGPEDAMHNTGQISLLVGYRKLKSMQEVAQFARNLYLHSVKVNGNIFISEQAIKDCPLPKPANEISEEGKDWKEVYGFFYNSNTAESAAGLQSLHISKDSAEKAMAWHKEEERKRYHLLHGKDKAFMKMCPFGFNSDWFVEPVKIEP